MQQLEKILEEIKQEKFKHWDSSERLATDKLIGWCFDKCTDIIRKHMGESWIPVKERLPEDAEDVIATTENGEEITLAWYGGDDWRSAIDGDSINVIAWRPLPEPYRPERSEDRE